jgi:hypothetical protein
MLELLTPTHLEIVNTLRQADITAVIENQQICTTEKIVGYLLTKINQQNQSGKSILLACPRTIQRNYQDWRKELNRTIAHEAVHPAQMCKSRDGYIRPLGFRKDIEAEAFAIQDNPKEVLRIVRKYCL